jgi:hypothetical protein
LARALFVCFVATFLPASVWGCKCEMTLSACNEVGASDEVFIGTVESIEPSFLNRWNLSSAASIRALNDAYLKAEQHPTDAALAHLKDTYYKTFPELKGDDRNDVNSAKNALELSSLFYLAMDRGMRVRFRVRTVFKQDEDDDDEPETLDVWNPFGDCGFDFQTGETYLVYANTEESSKYMFTGSCTRTQRLSDAGGDLAYLFFYKNDPEHSARLEGFATTDSQSQFAFDRLHAKESVHAPVEGVTIELRSPNMTRYDRSSASGAFTFDGLPEGNYQVSAYAAGFPEVRQLLAGPQPISIKEKSCTNQFLVLPGK